METLPQMLRRLAKGRRVDEIVLLAVADTLEASEQARQRAETALKQIDAMLYPRALDSIAQAVGLLQGVVGIVRAALAPKEKK